MNKLAYEGERYRGVDHQDSEIGEWSARYHTLVDALGKVGTLVRIVKTTERDQDFAPYNFVRGAVHEFVFPPQEVTPKEDLSKVIDPSHGYHLSTYNRTFMLTNPEAVEGCVRVWYSDAEGSVEFSIEDMLDDSRLPDEAMTAIAAAQLQEVKKS